MSLLTNAEMLERDWREIPWTPIDLETTGIDTSTAMPVELAACTFVRGRLLASFGVLLNPGCPIPDGARAVHGIGPEDVAEAPPAGSVADGLALALLALPFRGYPVGYNGQHYDRTILRRLAGADAETEPLLAELSVDWIDPLVIVRELDRFVGGKGRHTLSVTCARRGIAQGRAHRAMGDAEAAGRLLWAMRDEGPIAGLRTLDELLRWQRAKAAQQEASFAAYRARQNAGAS